MRERVRQIEAAHRPVPTEVVPTGTPLDDLFPGHGLGWGTLVEWLTPGAGSGTLIVTLAVAARILPANGTIVIVDPAGTFYPAAAAGIGLPLDRVAVVRPGSRPDALWALEHALRSGGATVVIGWIDRLSDRNYRRLQLASETGRGVGFLIRPAELRAEPSYAAARLLVEPRASDGPLVGWQFRVEAFRVRAGIGKQVAWELGDEADAEPLVPELADPTASPVPPHLGEVAARRLRTGRRRAADHRGLFDHLDPSRN